jgi:hypothetical protein
MTDTKSTRYKIVTASDGQHWITLQALLEDVKQQLDDPTVKANSHVFHSVESVKVFLEALVSEANYQQYQHEQLLARGDRSGEETYSETLQ